MSGMEAIKLTDKEWIKIKPHLNSFYQTGTTIFFGTGNDLDYVVIETEWNQITDYDYSTKEEGVPFICYKYIEKNKFYDFIVVDQERFEKWVMATETAIILIGKGKGFNEWFKNKVNRQKYFSAFIYD